MILLAVALLAITVAEYVGAWWSPRLPRWAEPMVLVLLALVPALALGLSAAGAAQVAIIALLWRLVRDEHPWEVAGLVVVGALLLLLLATASGEDRTTTWVDRTYDAVDLPALVGVPFEQVVLAVAVALFLLRPANAVVRIALEHAGPGILEEERSLRGGRLLGPLERLLIFFMALGGVYGVLAVVVAAKGILRFPEISRDAPEGTKAEYVLVGSFMSWALALAFVPLF